MAENRRGKENRFYFSRGQLVLLGVAFTFGSILIFFLGIFVGQGYRGKKVAQEEEPLVKIPVKPVAEGNQRHPSNTNTTKTRSPLMNPRPKRATGQSPPKKEPKGAPLEKIVKADVKEKAALANTDTPEQDR